MNEIPDRPDSVPACALEELSEALGRVLPNSLALHLANWRKLRRGADAPLLIDLFDESDPTTQPWLVVIDTERDDAQTVRLVGTGIVDFFGLDPTGSDFLLSVTPHIRAVFITAHRRLSSDLVGKFHVSICSTSTGRELEVFAFALPYRRKDGQPCAVWLLVPSTRLQYGETGSQVRSIIAQRWITLPAAEGPGGALPTESRTTR